MDYKQKYLKYKSKYAILKKHIGGMDDLKRLAKNEAAQKIG